VDQTALQRWFEESEERARASLIEQGVQRQTISFRRQYDARYRGQSFELTIDHGDSAESIAHQFHEAHRSRYGYDVPGEIVELVNARLAGSGSLPSRNAVPVPPAGLGAPRKEKRRLWLDGAFIDVPVLQRAALKHGACIEGPAIVEEYDCTTYLAPEWSLYADRGVLLLEKAAE
jgi:N-methylhydantoinase A/oxoprolinase/acetone carboxylase beta subunit